MKLVQHLHLGTPVNYGTFAIRKRLDAIAKLVRIENLKVLDVGCGNGAYTIELARKNKQVVGVDIQYGNLSKFLSQIYSNMTENCFVAQMDSAHLAFKDSYFDIVTCIEVMEHVPDELNLLREIYRVLNHGGYAVIAIPNKWFIFETHSLQIGRQIVYRIPFISWLPQFLHSHIATARIYKKKRVVSLLTSVGFKDIQVAYIYPPVDNLPVSERLRYIFRKLGEILEETPFKVFGVSLVVVGKK